MLKFILQDENAENINENSTDNESEEKESDLMYNNGISKIHYDTESEEVEINETENTEIPSEVHIEETSLFLYNLEDVELDQNTQVPVCLDY